MKISWLSSNPAIPGVMLFDLRISRKGWVYLQINRLVVRIGL